MAEIDKALPNIKVQPEETTVLDSLLDIEPVLIEQP